MRIARVTAVLASVLVCAFAARMHGQTSKATHSATSTHVMAAASDVKWGPGPDSLPAGAQLAVLAGDPSKAGAPFVVQAKLPDGYTVPPHWHPTDENVTVLNGTLQMAMGKTMDESALKDLGAGSFALMPAKAPHMARAKGDTIIQIHAIGPFEVTYVNAKDDPRKKATSTPPGNSSIPVQSAVRPRSLPRAERAFPLQFRDARWSPFLDHDPVIATGIARHSHQR